MGKLARTPGPRASLVLPAVGSRHKRTIEIVSIKLSDEIREEAVATIQLYARENFDEPMGDLAAGLFLDFLLQEVGPSIYNKGIADAQARLTARVAELDIEIGEEVFPYWPRQGRRRAR